MNALNAVESRLTHPVPNNFSQPAVSFEVAFESNSLAHNHGGQRLYGNCQITCKIEETQMENREPEHQESTFSQKLEQPEEWDICSMVALKQVSEKMFG